MTSNVASRVGWLIGAFVFIMTAGVTGIPRAGMAAPFAALVMDARSGEVLYENNADSRLHPASLTKMMTLYIVFQEVEAGRLSLDQMVTISKHAAAQPPSKLGLRPGQKIALRYLIRAAAIKSANDAATALGEVVGGGSEAAFAQRMTRTAKALGMRNSSFRNANGLTAQGHLSSARDMTILGRHLFYDFPQYYQLFSRRSADAQMATVHNTNRRFLDAYEGADGIKTGYTVAAGFNLTASAKRGNKRIIATVLGGASTPARNAKMAELLDLGFRRANGNSRTNLPSAAPIPQEALIADASENRGRTAVAASAMTRSRRPVARPMAAPDPAAQDAVALAILESVQGSMEPAAPPPEPQSAVAANIPAPAEEPAAAIADISPMPRPEIPDGTLEAQAVAMENGNTASPPPAGTFEAQAAALIEDISATEAALNAPAAAQMVATQPPQPRPADLKAPDSASAAGDAHLPSETTESVAAIESPGDAGPIPAEALSIGHASAVAVVVASADDVDSRKHRAPIFDDVVLASAGQEASGDNPDLEVINKSTSGGNNWIVNVGSYNSRYEAERVLLKTALEESATLSRGLRRITQSSGTFRASFEGLESEQAMMACHRLQTRGVACEAVAAN